MPKQLVQGQRFSLGLAADPSPLAIVIVAAAGLAFLVAEGVVLSAQGVHGVGYALIAIFAASTVSGFDSPAALGGPGLRASTARRIVPQPARKINAIAASSAAVAYRVLIK